MCVASMTLTAFTGALADESLSREMREARFLYESVTMREPFMVFTTVGECGE